MDEHRNRILFFMTAPVVAKAIYTAIELEIPDHLRGGPKAATELAELTGCCPEHLRRLLIPLGSVGIFAYSDGKFRNTALSETLKRDSEGSAWPIVSFFGREMYKAIDDLPTAVRTGKECWHETFGSSVWDYFDRHPERGRVFDEVMMATTLNEATVVCQAYDFSKARVIIDVGGGNGALLGAILESNENAEGVLFDLKKVIERARNERHRKAVYSRCTFIGGDFFAEVPPRGDVYVLKRVLHDWNDENSARILRACRAAMQPESRLLIVERSASPEPTDGRPTANWMDLGMMVFGGRERSAQAYERLLDTARLSVTRVIPTRGSITLIEAARA